MLDHFTQLLFLQCTCYPTEKEGEIIRAKEREREGVWRREGRKDRIRKRTRYSEGEREKERTRERERRKLTTR